MSAAGTAAPFWSATLPEIVPVIVWALEDEQKKPTTKSPSTNLGR
jgi:hypothetical protein